MTYEILGYTDVQKNENGNMAGCGWAYHRKLGCRPIRARTTSATDGQISYYDIDPITRDDVDRSYGGQQKYNECGWKYEFQNVKCVELEMSVEDDEWTTFYMCMDKKYKIAVEPDIFKTRQDVEPHYWVIDNFYEDPDKVRAFALEQNFKIHKKQHKGYRTETVFRPNSLKKRFEQIMHKEITNWEYYLANGVFQYCVEGNVLVYHQDVQQFAGVVYLTPDAPPWSGTSLYRSKANKLMKLTEADAKKQGKTLEQLHNETYANGFTNPDDFEVVDTFGNIYNRCVIWDGHMIHAANKYFGDSKENGRLFQLFFFDVKDYKD